MDRQAAITKMREEAVAIAKAWRDLGAKYPGKYALIDISHGRVGFKTQRGDIVFAQLNPLTGKPLFLKDSPHAALLENATICLEDDMYALPVYHQIGDRLLFQAHCDARANDVEQTFNELLAYCKLSEEKDHE